MDRKAKPFRKATSPEVSSSDGVVNENFFGHQSEESSVESFEDSSDLESYASDSSQTVTLDDESIADSSEEDFSSNSDGYSDGELSNESSIGSDIESFDLESSEDDTAVEDLIFLVSYEMLERGAKEIALKREQREIARRQRRGANVPEKSEDNVKDEVLLEYPQKEKISKANVIALEAARRHHKNEHTVDNTVTYSKQRSNQMGHGDDYDVYNRDIPFYMISDEEKESDSETDVYHDEKAKSIYSREIPYRKQVESYPTHAETSKQQQQRRRYRPPIPQSRPQPTVQLQQPQQEQAPNHSQGPNNRRYTDYDTAETRKNQKYGNSSNDTLNKQELRKEINGMWQEVELLSSKIPKLVSSIKATEEGKLENCLNVCHSLQKLSVEIIVSDISFGHAVDVESILWKCSFYKMIECFRKQISDVKVVIQKFEFTANNPNQIANKDNIMKNLDTARHLLARIHVKFLSFLQKGCDLYKNLITSLQEKYGFSLQLKTLIDMTMCADANFLQLFPSMRNGNSDPSSDPELLYKQFRSLKHTRQALVTCHRCFICMGDLERYTQQYKPPTKAKNWTGVSSLYACAKSLIPRNSKPYNQLAVVSRYENDPTATVYFYVRSLLVRQPFLTARDSLLQIFEQLKVQKKSLLDFSKAISVEEQRHRSKGLPNPGQENKNEEMIRELWFVDSSCVFDSEGIGLNGIQKGLKNRDYKDYKEDVNKKEIFISNVTETAQDAIDLSLLYHGILFTRTGLEYRHILQNQFLSSLKCLLKSDAIISNGVLLRMVIISLFSCEDRMQLCYNNDTVNKNVSGNSGSKESDNYEDSVSFNIDSEREKRIALDSADFPRLSPSRMVSSDQSSTLSNDDPFIHFKKHKSNVLLNFALGFIVDFYLILSNELLNNNTDEKITLILPCVKTILLWIYCRRELLIPMLTRNDDDSEKDVKCKEFWMTCAKLFNLCSVEENDTMENDTVDCVTSNSSLSKFSQTHFVLWEDIMCFGLRPLSEAHKTFLNMDEIADINVVNNKNESTKRRKKFITLLGNSLVQKVLPNLHLHYMGCLSKKDGIFHSLPVIERVNDGPSSSVEQEIDFVSEKQDQKGNDDQLKIANELNQLQNRLLNDNRNDKALEMLKRKRERLGDMLNVKKTQESYVQKRVVEEQNSEVMTMHINLKYLMFDTNCFIDYLPAIERLVQSQKFTVLCPLVVYNELEGLKRGSTELTSVSSISRNDYIKQKCEEAIGFIESCFKIKSGFMKLLTSQGNILNSTKFRNETISQENKVLGNDDLILNSCVQFVSRGCKVSNNTAEGDASTQANDTEIRRNLVLITKDINLKVRAHTERITVRDVPSLMRILKSVL